MPSKRPKETREYSLVRNCQNEKNKINISLFLHFDSHARTCKRIVTKVTEMEWYCRSLNYISITTITHEFEYMLDILRLSVVADSCPFISLVIRYISHVLVTANRPYSMMQRDAKKRLKNSRLDFILHRICTFLSTV